MKRVLFGMAAASLAVVLLAGVDNVMGQGDKVSIKDVMAKAMKGGLCKKVASGKASDDEKKELVTLFTAMASCTPPKGEAASWKEKTSALVAAAKAGDGKALGAAANCAACHKVHK